MINRKKRAGKGTVTFGRAMRLIQAGCKGRLA
jgi:hypothetical protein